MTKFLIVIRSNLSEFQKALQLKSLLEELLIKPRLFIPSFFLTIIKYYKECANECGPWLM